MTDPTTRPADVHGGIDNATEEVVDAWQDATDGKDPVATTDDFERMRDGFRQVAEDGIAAAAERGTPADRGTAA